jgi:hypothetical protein
MNLDVQVRNLVSGTNVILFSDGNTTNLRESNDA